MDSPQNHLWGPALWMILHSTAERIGTKTIHRLPQEETRLWTGLLNSLRYSLPCPQCKKHYIQFISSRPIVAPCTRENIRVWLYDLHCQVNQYIGKKNTLTIEKIIELYNQPFCFTKYLHVVSSQMIQSLKLKWSSREDIQRTLRFFEEVKRFYDFF